MLEDIRTGKYRSMLSQPRQPTRLHDRHVNPVSMVEFERETAQYEKDRAAFLGEDRRLDDAFRADLLAHFEMTDHPKGSLLFEKCWSLACAMEDGCGNFENAYHLYADLVVLVK